MTIDGIAIVAYFAAHAPPVPDWFKHEPSTPCPIVPDMDGTNHVEHFERKVARDSWQAQQREEKFFKWRWYYAYKMMEGIA